MNPKFCDLCRNSGLVSMYHPAIVHGTRIGSDSVTSSNGTTVKVRRADGSLNLQQPTFAPCKCSKGHPHSSWTYRDGTTRDVPRFGSKRLHVAQLGPMATDEEIIDHIMSSMPLATDNVFNDALSSF